MEILTIIIGGVLGLVLLIYFIVKFANTSKLSNDSINDSTSFQHSGYHNNGYDKFGPSITPYSTWESQDSWENQNKD